MRVELRAGGMWARGVITFATLVLTTGCELAEVVVAEPEDIVVAEVVLYAGDPVQRALLHRTFGDGTGEVPGAQVEVASESGSVLSFAAAPIEQCVTDQSDLDSVRGTCYVSQATAGGFVQPGQRYKLAIRRSDGRVLTGTTLVPGSFTLEHPVSTPTAPCFLQPDHTVELAWTRAADAWVYVVEAELRGLRRALDQRGVRLDVDPLRLVGLSVSAADTTIRFPTEVGIFNRFDTDVSAALVAIQTGLPPGVEVEMVVAATDRNYVNWARGGRFNPSGQIRVPSVQGEGTGLFGSATPIRFRITTDASVPRPPC